MTVNRVTLVGRLGSDPDCRTTQSGTTVANLNLATSERQKDRDGNWAEHTEWHKVVCFGRTAENVGKFLAKGRQIYVEGRLRTNKWQDKEGRDRWTTEVIADRIHFLGSKSDGGGGSYGGGNSGGGSYGGNSGGGNNGNSGGGNGGGGGDNSGGGNGGNSGGGNGGGGSYGGDNSGGGSFGGDSDIPF